MKQKFTVELEREVLKKATIDVVADNIADARQKALIKGRSSYVWSVQTASTRVLKITAHAGEVADDAR